VTTCWHVELHTTQYDSCSCTIHYHQLKKRGESSLFVWGPCSQNARICIIHVCVNWHHYHRKPKLLRFLHAPTLSPDTFTTDCVGYRHLNVHWPHLSYMWGNCNLGELLYKRHTSGSALGALITYTIIFGA